LQAAISERENKRERQGGKVVNTVGRIIADNARIEAN